MLTGLYRNFETQIDFFNFELLLYIREDPRAIVVVFTIPCIGQGQKATVVNDVLPAHNHHFKPTMKHPIKMMSAVLYEKVLHIRLQHS